MDWLTNEGIAVKFVAEKRVAIDADAATGRHTINGARIVKPFQCMTAGIKQVSVRSGGNSNAR